MLEKLMTNSQFVQMLEALPYASVMDAVADVRPRVTTNAARAVLSQCERQGFILRERDVPKISLTKNGISAVRALKEDGE